MKDRELDKLRELSANATLQQDIVIERVVLNMQTLFAKRAMTIKDTYQHTVTLVDDWITTGQEHLMLVVGPSSSGKSTLGYCLLDKCVYVRFDHGADGGSLDQGYNELGRVLTDALSFDMKLLSGSVTDDAVRQQICGDKQVNQLRLPVILHHMSLPCHCHVVNGQRVVCNAVRLSQNDIDSFRLRPDRRRALYIDEYNHLIKVRETVGYGAFMDISDLNSNVRYLRVTCRVMSIKLILASTNANVVEVIGNISKSSPERAQIGQAEGAPNSSRWWARMLLLNVPFVPTAFHILPVDHGEQHDIISNITGLSDDQQQIVRGLCQMGPGLAVARFLELLNAKTESTSSLTDESSDIISKALRRLGGILYTNKMHAYSSTFDSSGEHQIVQHLVWYAYGSYLMLTTGAGTAPSQVTNHDEWTLVTHHYARPVMWLNINNVWTDQAAIMSQTWKITPEPQASGLRERLTFTVYHEDSSVQGSLGSIVHTCATSPLLHLAVCSGNNIIPYPHHGMSKVMQVFKSASTRMSSDLSAPAARGLDVKSTGSRLEAIASAAVILASRCGDNMLNGIDLFQFVRHLCRLLTIDGHFVQAINELRDDLLSVGFVVPCLSGPNHPWPIPLTSASINSRLRNYERTRPGAVVDGYVVGMPIYVECKDRSDSLTWQSGDVNVMSIVSKMENIASRDGLGGETLLGIIFANKVALADDDHHVEPEFAYCSIDIHGDRCLQSPDFQACKCKNEQVIIIIHGLDHE